LTDNTVAFPDYDGNGMYRTLGNLTVNPNVGLLFISFDNPARLRINGSATVERNHPLLKEYPGSVYIVKVTARSVFPNCPRYVHTLSTGELSPYLPREDASPLVPEWKSKPPIVDYLPTRDLPKKD
jgi:hypothetical protein